MKQTPLLVCPTLLPSVEQLAIPEFWTAFWSLFFAADFSADTAEIFGRETTTEEREERTN